MLLPGQYKYQTFVDNLKDKKCYASFKGPKRFNGPGIAGLVDKVCYASVNYDQILNLRLRCSCKPFNALI